MPCSIFHKRFSLLSLIWHRWHQLLMAVWGSWIIFLNFSSFHECNCHVSIWTADKVVKEKWGATNYFLYGKRDFHHLKKQKNASLCLSHFNKEKKKRGNFLNLFVYLIFCGMWGFPNLCWVQEGWKRQEGCLNNQKWDICYQSKPTCNTFLLKCILHRLHSALL